MLTYIDAIPAKQTIARNESLNVLGGVVNSESAAIVDISLWGRVDIDWQRLETRRFELAAQEHKHIYFTLNPEVLSTTFCGKEIEELELAISDSEPTKPSVIVFIE